MTLQDLINAVNNRVDDTIDSSIIIEYLNAGQNVMAQEVGASFTQFVLGSMSATPDFDSVYHEVPVLYACMRIKEMDSVLTEAANYRNQFEERKKWFVMNYRVPAYLRDDRISQQFVAVAGQQAFVITKPTYNPQQGSLVVYKTNYGTTTSTDLVSWTRVISTITDSSQASTTTTTTNDPRGFILTYTCAAGDKITAVWEEHNDVVNPPYPWWNGQGW